MFSPNSTSQFDSVVMKRNKNNKNDKAPHLTYEQSRYIHLTKAEDDERNHEKQTNVDVRKQIQQARLNKKLSQKELGNKINVSEKVIKELESGVLKNPSPHLIQKLRNVLEIKIKLV